MTAIALKTAGKLRVVASWEQLTLEAAEAIAPGQASRQDTTNGKATLSKASSAPEAKMFGICVSKTATNLGVTLLRRGIIDGYDLDALDYDALVYLSDTDGTLADTPGTNAIRVGRVIRGFGTVVGATEKKLLLVEPDLAAETSLAMPRTESFRMNANGSLADQAFFIADRAYRVTRIDEIHSTAGNDASAVNVQVTKDTSTDAPGAGTNLLTNNTNAGFNLKGTANTVQNGTLSATGSDLLLAAGDRLSVDFAGTLTAVAGVVITVSLQPV